MYQFKGVLKNEHYAESGVNMVVKGLEEEKIILAPTGPWHEFEKKQESADLAFTITPSSGTTEVLTLNIEVKNGKEQTTTNELNWEIKITADSDSEPVEFELVIAFKEEEFEEEPKP